MTADITRFADSIPALKKLVRGLGLIGQVRFNVYANGEWADIKDGELIFCDGRQTVFTVARVNALIGFDGTEAWSRPSVQNTRPFRVDISFD